jgi:hypothetical protein
VTVAFQAPAIPECNGADSQCRNSTYSFGGTADAAAAAAARSGGPVTLNADMPDLAVRRKGTGAVLLDLHGADEVRRGFGTLQKAFGDCLADPIVQPMITGGVEATINVLEEQLTGPVVLFGLAADADVLAGRAARLAP